MKRLSSLCFIVCFVLFGCGGGGGGPAPPANVAGKWVGSMDHDINGTLHHYNVALLLFQDGAHVTGTMVLEYGDNGHGGDIDGQMNGTHFTGYRIARHIVDIQFDVVGDTLVGTFDFVSLEENLDEHGTFTCKREQVIPDLAEQVAAAPDFYGFSGKELTTACMAAPPYPLSKFARMI